MPHSKKGFTGKGFLFLAFREYRDLETKIAADANPVISVQEELSRALGHLSISSNPNLSFRSHFGICNHPQKPGLKKSSKLVENVATVFSG